MCIVDIVETSLAKSYKFAHFSDQSHFTSMKNSHGSPLNDNFYEFSMGKNLPDPQFWSSSLTLALTILYVQILDEIPIKTLVFHSAKFIFRRTHMIMIL